MPIYERKPFPWRRTYSGWSPTAPITRRSVQDARPDGYGEAARSYSASEREKRRNGSRGLSETLPRENTDGSVTLPFGTRTTLVLGYQKQSPGSPTDWAFRTAGELVLSDAVTVRQTDAAMDLDAGIVTRTYRIEPHAGDGWSSKQGFLDELRLLSPQLFEGLPQAPVRAIRLQTTRPGYKRVS